MCAAEQREAGMVTIDTVGDTIRMLAAIAVLGLVGGFVGELIANRSGRTGAVERPRRTGRVLFDLGSWAALPVGAVAALVAALFFSPVVAGEGGTSKYDLVRLTGGALLAGVAGPALLGLARDRFLAALSQERADAALTAALKAQEAGQGPQEAAAVARAVRAGGDG
jgi:hypothetical protein